MTTWQKLRLLPTLIKSGMAAPKSASLAWENYWSSVAGTGRDGDVLWDPNHEPEHAFCLEGMKRHADVTLPVLDAGCGNGRFTRLLASYFPSAIGVDVSPSAVKRASSEAPLPSNARFLVADLTDPAWGDATHAELGDANLFIRGVLHVLTEKEKQRFVASARSVLGRRGVVFLLETAFPGSALDYLEFLGARDGELPPPLRRAVESGIPKPGRFGEAELKRNFPDSQFQVLEAGAAPVFAVGMQPEHELEIIPGFFAALRNR